MLLIVRISEDFDIVSLGDGLRIRCHAQLIGLHVSGENRNRGIRWSSHWWCHQWRCWIPSKWWCRNLGDWSKELYRNKKRIATDRDGNVLSSCRLVKTRTEEGRRDISGGCPWGQQVFKALPKLWGIWNGESIQGIEENKKLIYAPLLHLTPVCPCQLILASWSF